MKSKSIEEKLMRVCHIVFSLILSSYVAVVTPVAIAQSKERGPAVVPQAERDLAAKKQLAGPTQNRGIRSVTSIGGVPLGPDFPALEGKQLRARVLVVDPGGVVAVHEHDRRPGVAYILEGEIYEHRSDQPQPLLRKQGDAAFEQTGIAHWWENKSNQPVRALVVDIVPVETGK